MMSIETIDYIAYAWTALAVATFILLLFVVAPFGRHSRTDWGPMINNRLAWMIMEAVSLLVFNYFFWTGSGERSTAALIFATLWSLHYINRSFIYPFRQKDKQKKMPAIIMIFAIIFNSVNGFLNGYYLGNFSDYDQNYLMSAFFIAGFLLFAVGFYINLRSDNMLLDLRSDGSKDYKIPRGFLFESISCPNHFGEIIEWIGFAIMTLNPASLSFAVWTFANLAPRSIAHHKWYQSHFPEYPKNRKAVVPRLL